MSTRHGTAMRVAAADADESISDEELPPLFEDDAKDLQPTEYGTKRLHSECGWSVIERRRPNGLVARWLVQETALSLDQTRVELRLGDEDGDEPCFVRDRLNSLFHQASALALAMALSGDSSPSALPRICVLGGGGMALPMALLTALPSLEATVVERDAAATRLARRFFGAGTLTQGSQERLQVIEADALSFIVKGLVPQDTSMLSVDIDFLRGAPEPPAELMSTEFWAAAWRAVHHRGLVCINAIGASPALVDTLAHAALAGAGFGTSSLIGAWDGAGSLVGAGSRAHGLVAGALEPAGSAERSTWSPFVPRPSALVIGHQELLRPLAGPHAGLEVLLERQPWVRPLARDILRDLAAGDGQSGRWRWIAQ